MGREVRRVPMNWEHPRDERGRYIPLKDGYWAATREWNDAWMKHTGSEDEFFDFYGSMPHPEDYIMPDWDESERVGWQMYENVTEGTPISPVMESAEALARWLADNEASAFGSMTASYGQWLAMILSGYAPSMVMIGGRIDSGVAYTADSGMARKAQGL